MTDKAMEHDCLSLTAEFKHLFNQGEDFDSAISAYKVMVQRSNSRVSNESQLQRHSIVTKTGYLVYAFVPKAGLLATAERPLPLAPSHRPGKPIASRHTLRKGMKCITSILQTSPRSGTSRYVLAITVKNASTYQSTRTSSLRQRWEGILPFWKSSPWPCWTAGPSATWGLLTKGR